MAEVLCVYREVALLKQARSSFGDKMETGATQGGEAGAPDVAIISYNEKPGI